MKNVSGSESIQNNFESISEPYLFVRIRIYAKILINWAIGYFHNRKSDGGQEKNGARRIPY